VRLFFAAFSLAFSVRASALLAAPNLPFWFDEAWTAQFATFPSSPLTVVRRVATEDLHPPLGYLVYKAWAGLLGVRDEIESPPPPGHEDRLRSLPLLAGALGAGFLALAAFRLGASEAVALASALFFAVSPVALSVGLEVRQYGLLLFLFPLLLYAFVTGQRWFFALVGAVALYTHYGALLFLLPFALHRPFRLPVSFAFLLFLPWLPTLFHQITSPLMTEARMHALPLAELLSPFFASLGGDALLGFALFALAGLGLRRTPLFLPAMGLFVALFALFASQNPGGNPRYAVLLVPYIALGLAFALEALRERSRGIPALLLLLPPVALLSVSLPWAIGFRENIASQGKATIFAVVFPLEPVYVYNRSAAYIFRYYERKKAVEEMPLSPPQRPALIIAPAKPILLQITGVPPWLLEAKPAYFPGSWGVYLWPGSK
jgi:uncharacterized membrane protein